MINLVKGLDREKFRPFVCALNNKGPFAGELENEGINVLELNKKRKIEIFLIKRLAEIMTKNDIDIVHTHLWGGNFWGRVAAKRAKVKAIIATEHNSDTWKNAFHFFLDRRLYRWTDRLIAVSESVKKFYA